jgi:outer membrane protein assembly factor BamB
MGPGTQSTGSVIRHIAAPQAGKDIFATAEFEEKVTLWSMRDRKKLAEIRTVLDFGGARLAVVQESSFCLLIAGRFGGPLNAYDLEGNVLWSRRDLVGVQNLASILTDSEPAIGVGADDQPYRILSALNGKEIVQLNGIKEVYASSMTTQILAITSNSAMFSAAVGSAPLWKQPLRSFAVLHGCLSSSGVAYSEAAGAMYCFDLFGTQKWILNPEKGHHFLKLAWNQPVGRWMAIDWDYAHGGSKRLLGISPTGSLETVADLGEPAETEFFTSGGRLVTSSGDVFDLHSGQVIWNFLKE